MASPSAVEGRRAVATKGRTGFKLPYLKIVVWIGALTPAAILIVRALNDDLGANPIEKVTHWTGLATLNLLMITLAITPLRRITGYNELIKLRRPLGLFAFFYVCLHFLTYVVLDLFFDFSIVVEDILERPYITVGFTAFLLLIPLALTSTKGWIRRLGKRWVILHRLIYLIAGLGVLHYFWKESSKSDVTKPLIFAGVLATLLIIRIVYWRRKTATKKAGPRSRVESARPAA